MPRISLSLSQPRVSAGARQGVSPPARRQASQPSASTPWVGRFRSDCFWLLASGFGFWDPPVGLWLFSSPGGIFFSPPFPTLFLAGTLLFSPIAPLLQSLNPIGVYGVICGTFVAYVGLLFGVENAQYALPLRDFVIRFKQESASLLGIFYDCVASFTPAFKPFYWTFKAEILSASP